MSQETTDPVRPVAAPDAPVAVAADEKEARIWRRSGWALATAAAIGGAALPLWREGVGWLICAVAVTTAVAVVARFDANGGEARTARRGGQRFRRAWSVWQGGAGLAAMVLVAVPGIRDAGWLDGLCLVTALALGSYALTGGSTWLELARATYALPLAALRSMRSPRLISGGIRMSDTVRVGVGITIGFGLLVVFGLLFRAADPAFADLTHRVQLWVSVAGTVRAVGGAVLVAGTALGAVALISGRRRGTVGPGGRAVPASRTWAEWAIPIGMLDVMFGAFVWIQITVLFGGQAYVLRPGGPDYAEYARSGSAYLLVATALTLVVVTALALWAGRATPTQRTLLRVLGGALCGLTLVIVASGLTRLALYAQAYGFTRTRLLANAAEVWLGLIFVAILAAGLRLRATWLPRVVVACGVAVLLALAAVNPEALMARSHERRLTMRWPLDEAFLTSLSADAIDEIDRLPEPVRSCSLLRVAQDLRTPDPWYATNLARIHARQVIAYRPVECRSSPPM